jgi:glyoxylase-like metal-dependent hydrolase (beta-lactamase superfamily II)
MEQAMQASETSDTTLTWEVLTMKRPGLSRDVPSGKESLQWVANSATLISGAQDAVLVDTFLTVAQTRALIDWVSASGKKLTTIYVTHGHGDHFFGLAMLLERFPGARAVAVPAVVEAMRDELAEVDGFWRKLFPGEIPERLAVAEPLEADAIDLEGHRLVPVDTGRTDTARSTSLHVPSIGLLVAGDVVYNGIHPFLSETDAQSRIEWISALDRLEALAPGAVVAGHKVPGNPDDPADIGRTRQYLRDFNRLAGSSSTARALYDAMMLLYPDRANPGSLWRSANAAKGG